MREAFIKLHISVILAGLTGLFGKLVTLHQLPMVLYRVGFAAIILGVILLIRHQLLKIPFKNVLRIGFVGALLAMHWVFFFGSIKASNISVGVVCYSLVGFFSAVLEPVILHTRFSLRDVLLSLVTVLGIYLIFHFDVEYRYGIMLGVVSSLLASLFTIYNKKVVDNVDYPLPSIIFYEFSCGTLVIILALCVMMPQMPEVSIIPSISDVLWILVLSSLCTICLQLLQIDVLKTLSAFTVNLTYNLEPIYSIIIAMTVFHEAQSLSVAFFAGLALIILSVVAKTWLIVRQSRVHRSLLSHHSVEY